MLQICSLSSFFSISASARPASAYLKDCSDVSNSSGIYSIHVDSKTEVEVECLEGGWTVIQSRGQFGYPSNYFDRGWTEYEAGFGVPGEMN